MQTVFSYIVQKRFSQVNEDVATDALAYLLTSSAGAYTDFKKPSTVYTLIYRN